MLYLRVVLPHHLCGLDGVHLLGPARRGLELAYCPNLVEGIAGYADVIVAFEDNLDVANVKSRVWSDFG